MPRRYTARSSDPGSGAHTHRTEVLIQGPPGVRRTSFSPIRPNRVSSHRRLGDLRRAAAAEAYAQPASDSSDSSPSHRRLAPKWPQTLRRAQSFRTSSSRKLSPSERSLRRTNSTRSLAGRSRRLGANGSPSNSSISDGGSPSARYSIPPLRRRGKLGDGSPPDAQEQQGNEHKDEVAGSSDGGMEEGAADSPRDALPPMISTPADSEQQRKSRVGAYGAPQEGRRNSKNSSYVRSTRASVNLLNARPLWQVMQQEALEVEQEKARRRAAGEASDEDADASEYEQHLLTDDEYNAAKGVFYDAYKHLPAVDVAHPA